MMLRRHLLPAALAMVAALGAHADEGMWTFNDFPADKVKARYGFEPTKAWLDHLRLASVRLAGGCSASVVSPQGLVMTNHHCVRGCVDDQSGLLKKDFSKNGFLAKTLRDELRCDTFELNQLAQITDVTARVTAATEGVPAEKFNDAQRAVLATIEKECAASDELRCEVVSLYRGGRYDLYQYRRFQDVRLVFAPEASIAFFGGDPDNFMFPRYNLDVSFLRIYGRDGKPLPMQHSLGWSRAPLSEDELTFVAGNPGGTSRLMTVSQLEDNRDVRLPAAIARLSEIRGWTSLYQSRGPEQKRHSNDLLFGVENSLKAMKGRHAALADKGFFASRLAAEKALRAQVESNPEWKRQFGGAWDEIASAVQRGQVLRREHAALERGPLSELFDHARFLVRAADELEKSNPKRLREYSDSRLPQLKQRLASKSPMYDELEIEKLHFSLVKMREDLGPDHHVIRHVFGGRNLREWAEALVRGSKLDDPKVRDSLFKGGKAAIEASADPMIVLAKALDADARAIRAKVEDEVEGPIKKHGERIAKARFLAHGTSTYPDATFTLRLSYGRVKGYQENGATVAPFTSFAGLYERHNGTAPFDLPQRWLEVMPKLDLDTQFNVCTTNDIIGGNSGSPLVSRAGEVVGLVFDGNIQSLGGDYGFDESVNRTVAVTATAIAEALQKVYGAQRIVDELRPAAQGAPRGSESANTGS
jgi:hypothetical protein